MKRMQSSLTLTLLLFFVLQNVFAEQSFSLNSGTEDYSPFEVKLPRGLSTISMDMQLTMPVSEFTVPTLFLKFPGSGPEMLADIAISDTLCTGEYNTAARFFAKQSQMESLYFQNKIPWPETIPVEIKVNRKSERGYEHLLKIYGETQTIYTKNKMKKFIIDITGEVFIEGLKIIKED